MSSPLQLDGDHAPEVRLLRVLLIDDSETDAQLVLRQLQRDGFNPVAERVSNGPALRMTLAQCTWDVILCDFSMPGFSGSEALDIVKQTGKDIPFLVVTGTVGEEAAVLMMKAGAQDFVVKDRIGRLAPAIRREMTDAQGRRQQQTDARARIESQQQLEVANRQLRMLSAKVMQVQEREREHLSRGLHDDVGQALTGLQLQLEALKRRVGSAAEVQVIDDSLQIVNQVLSQVRDLSLDLRPPQLDTLGLAPALRWYAERKVGAAPGLALSFRTANLPRLHPDIETTCFRIVQEVITNVLRHAHATELTIEVSYEEDQLQVVVLDNGVGFDVTGTYERAIRGESLGLLNMQERAGLVGGRVELRSRPGATAITIRLPETPSSAMRH